MNAINLLAVLISVSLAVTGQTLLKAGMIRVGPIDGARVKHPGELFRSVVSHWQVWLGFTAYFLSAFAWIFTLSRVPLSLAYPFLGLSYVGVAAAAILLLGESLTISQWLGIALVVAGVVMVALTG